jgi:DNA-binding MarR family transcriptional regulator
MVVKPGGATVAREEALSRVIGALTGWTVAVAQFNGVVAARLGVTETGLQCLYVLSRHGPTTAGEVGRRVNLTSGAASRMLDRLEAAGHVRRVPDQRDRRRVLVEATAESLDRVAALYTPLTDRLREHLADLDDDLVAELGRFAAAAEESTDAEIRRL